MNYAIKLAIRKKKTTATWQSVELWSTLQSLDSPTSYTNQSQWLLWTNLFYECYYYYVQLFSEYKKRDSNLLKFEDFLYCA